MRQLLILLLKYVAGLVLGGATLWWVVDRAGPVDGSVLVHVIEADVEVTIGGLSFPIDERRFAPIECRFRPGRYRLQMTRGERILYEEWFIVRRGSEIILTASCPPEPSMARAADPDSDDPTSKEGQRTPGDGIPAVPDRESRALQTQ